MICFSAVSHAYASGNPVLCNISLEVHHAEALVLIGRSGRGNAIAALLLYGLLPIVRNSYTGICEVTVINIGTATLAAFIGAGGLGEPIVTGLALNSTPLILRGSIPAALLAIATEYGFAGLERLCIPRGLRARS